MESSDKLTLLHEYYEQSIQVSPIKAGDFVKLKSSLYSQYIYPQLDENFIGFVLRSNPASKCVEFGYDKNLMIVVVKHNGLYIEYIDSRIVVDTTIDCRYHGKLLEFALDINITSIVHGMKVRPRIHTNDSSYQEPLIILDSDDDNVLVGFCVADSLNPKKYEIHTQVVDKLLLSPLK